MKNTTQTRQKYLLIVLLLFILLNLYGSNIYVVGIINISSLIILSAGIKKLHGKLLAPFLLVAASLYVFHSGHLWLALINISPQEFLTSFEYDYRTTNYPYIIDVYKGITMMLLIFMSTGIAFLRPFCPSINNYQNQSFEVTKLFNSCFLVLYFVSMVFEFKRASAVAATSYGEGYLYESSLALLIASCTNVIFLLFMYIYRNDKKKFKFYLFLMLFRTLFIMFFVGNRGASVINLIVTMFIIASYSYMSTDSAKLRKITISAVVFMVVALPFISATRDLKRSNVDVSVFAKEKSPIESFFQEFGGTASNVFLAKDYVNVIGSAHGIQLLGTSLSVLPGSTMMFGDIINDNVSIGMKLNLFNDREGLGGSLVSQLYFNFWGSWFLYMSMFLCGLLVAWTSNQLTMKKKSLYKTLFFLSMFSGLMTWVRGEWYDVVTQVKICMYIIIILSLFKDKLLKKYD